MSFTGFLARRLIGAVVVLLGVSTVVFVVLRVTGDPVAMLLPPEAQREDFARLRAQLGLDQPLPVQYAQFMGGILTGQLGKSYRYGDPVASMVLDRVPATAQLALAAVTFALALAIPLGVFSAIWRGSLFDTLASAFAFLGMAVPIFWLGTMLILVFAVSWRLLPTSGYGQPVNLILPAVTLGAYPLAQFTRLIRSEMLEVLGEDYIRTARAKGLSERSLLVGHALKNASIALVTLVGLNVGVLLGGAIITETIFAWPGVGRLVVQAIEFRDFPLVQGAVIFVALIMVFVNLVVDVLYGYLDPRIRNA